MKSKAKLWQDERGLRQRLPLCLLPPLAVSFTVLLFGPLEIYCANPNAVRFSLGDLVLGMGPLFLACWLAMAGVLLLLRGRVLDAASGLCFGAAAGVWLQGNVMNLDLGVLDGEPIAWQETRVWGFVNLGIWLVILAVPVVLWLLRPAWLRRVAVLGSALLVAMQALALVTFLPGAPTVSREYYHIDSEHIFEVSGKKNTIVFILDRFSRNLLEAAFEAEPALQEDLSDFTWFDNYSGEFLSTYPAVTSMLTGYRYDGTEGAQAYLDSAWGSESATAFYSRMREAGFVNRLFINERYSFGSGENIAQRVDNVGRDELGMDYFGMAKTMTKLSLYRYAPHLAKPRFWMVTQDLGGARGGIYYDDFYNVNFAIDFGHQGLRSQEETDCFTVYHIQGPHTPYVMDENMNVVEESSELQQTIGALRLVDSYFDALREQGLYDDANIIITTDHGGRKNIAAVFLAKQSGETHDEMPVNLAPVSAEDLLPTILYMNGLPYEDLGTPVYEWQEGQARERWFTPLGETKNLPQMNGQHNCLFVYRVPQDVRELEIGDERSYTALEVDSFY